MALGKVGLSAEDVYTELLEDLNRDPDLLRLLDSPRLERLITTLCRAVGRVLEENNEAIAAAVAEALAKSRRQTL